MQTMNNKSLPGRILNRAKDGLFIAPLLPWWRRRLAGKVMIYLYHRIGPEGEHRFLDEGGSPLTGVDEFCADLRLLRNLGAKFIRFSDLAQCDFDRGEFNVVISVDDGFASNYQAGMQAAENEGVPLTIFQCSAMVDASTLIWEHQLYFLYFDPRYSDSFQQYIIEHTAWPASLQEIREGIHPKEIQQLIDTFLSDQAGLSQELSAIAGQIYPTAEQLVTAHGSGHQIASHGDHHFKRSNIEQAEFEQELSRSRTKLEGIIGAKVTAFSYPFNAYLPGDELVCARHYTMVATVDGGCVTPATPLLAVPRNTFPGAAKNRLRQRRWLMTGSI